MANSLLDGGIAKNQIGWSKNKNLLSF